MSKMYRSDVIGTYDQFCNYKTAEEQEITKLKNGIDDLINTANTFGGSWNEINNVFNIYKEKLDKRKQTINDIVDVYFKEAKSILINYLDSSPTGPSNYVSDDNLEELKSNLNSINYQISQCESNLLRKLGYYYYELLGIKNNLERLIDYISRLKSQDNSASRKVSEIYDKPLKITESINIYNLESESTIVNQSMDYFEDKSFENFISTDKDAKNSIDLANSENAIDEPKPTSGNIPTKTNSSNDSNISINHTSSINVENNRVLSEYIFESSGLKPGISYPDETNNTTNS